MTRSKNKKYSTKKVLENFVLFLWSCCYCLGFCCCCCYCLFLRESPLYIVLAVLELTRLTRLASNSQSFFASVSQVLGLKTYATMPRYLRVIEKIIVSIFNYIYLCVHTARMWRPENNFWVPVFFDYVGLRDRAKVAKLGDKVPLLTEPPRSPWTFSLTICLLIYTVVFTGFNMLKSMYYHRNLKNDAASKIT